MKWNPINRSSRQPPSPARTRLLRNRLARVNPRVATSCSADDDRPVAGPAATAGPTGPSSPPSMPDRCGRLEPDQGMGGRSRGPLATAPVHPAAGRPLERRQLDDREHAAGERATQWCGRQRVEQRLGLSMTVRLLTGWVSNRIRGCRGRSATPSAPRFAQQAQDVATATVSVQLVVRLGQSKGSGAGGLRSFGAGPASRSRPSNDVPPWPAGTTVRPGTTNAPAGRT
jgi:hypothetical protein